MRTRQARKILRYANGGTRHQYSKYWYIRLVFYGYQPAGRKDHRISEALKTYQRHGRCYHPLAHPERYMMRTPRKTASEIYSDLKGIYE